MLKTNKKLQDIYKVLFLYAINKHRRNLETINLNIELAQDKIAFYY